MELINPNFKVIKYGRKSIKVHYSDLIKTDNCYGLYDPNTQTVNFDQNMKGEVFLNTLLHEIFHIIIYNEGMNIKDRGEEPIVNALGNGLVKVLKQNKKVRNFIYDCFEKKNDIIILSIKEVIRTSLFLVYRRIVLKWRELSPLLLTIMKCPKITSNSIYCFPIRSIIKGPKIFLYIFLKTINNPVFIYWCCQRLFNILSHFDKHFL